MAEESPSLHKNIKSNPFRHDIIKEILRSKFSNPKNRISDDAVELILELGKAAVVEAAARACLHARQEDRASVSLYDVECVLPQMMLDFP